MSALWPLALHGLTGICALMIVTWLVSLRVRDASIVDRVWGLGFVLQVWIYVLGSGAASGLALLTALMVSIWGMRLSIHIHLRNRAHGEDYRYARMRKRHGARFWWYSLFSVFLLQGLIAWVVAAPLLWIAAYRTPVNGAAFVVAGVAVWALGLFFEAVGDWQLARFKSDPANEGKLLTRGLWSLSRHPNYFGDATLWWGYFLVACAVESGWMSFFGPLLMTLLIRYVSGVAMLEKDQIAKRPAYADYIRNTPAMIPRFWPATRAARQ